MRDEKVIYVKRYKEEVKCPLCLWHTYTLYSFTENIDEEGLCAYCFLDLLLEVLEKEEGYKIIKLE